MGNKISLTAAELAALTKGARGRTAAEVLREYWTGTGHPGPTRFALEREIKWATPTTGTGALTS